MIVAEAGCYLLLVTHPAELWHLLAFFDAEVLVVILEAFCSFYRYGSKPMAVSDYFQRFLNSSFSYWDFFFFLSILLPTSS